jgi:hypothetical protein
MKKALYVAIAAVIFLWCFSDGIAQASADGNLLCQYRKSVAQSTPACAVTRSKVARATGYTENVVVEAYVENFTDKYAKNIVVTFVLVDPTGKSGFDGNAQPRNYGTWSAFIPELKPKGAQWVTISTAVARPLSINEGARIITVELAGPSKEFSMTRVDLIYRLDVEVTGGLSDH